jgi:hypothetical protein
MVSSAYFRQQANVCLQLARSLSDPKAVGALIAIAEDFIAKASEIDLAGQVDRSSECRTMG